MSKACEQWRTVSDSNLRSPFARAQMRAHTLTHMEIPKERKKREEEESHVQEKEVKENARGRSYTLRESHIARSGQPGVTPIHWAHLGLVGGFPMPWQEKPLSSQRQTLWACAWQCCQKLRRETSVSFIALSDMTQQSTVLSLTLFPCWDIPLTWNALLNSFRGHIFFQIHKTIFIFTRFIWPQHILYTNTYWRQTAPVARRGGAWRCPWKAWEAPRLQRRIKGLLHAKGWMLAMVSALRGLTGGFKNAP